MQLLIEDLLAFSQTTGNESNFEHTDLNIILAEVKSILSQTIEDSRTVIESGPLPVVKGIPFQLQQLLLNLTGNAIKYAKEGVPPQISISSRMVKGDQFSGAVAGRSYFELSVTDNGIGFEEEHTEKIFGLFQRLHNKDKYSGTGIGLAICKKIVHNHHGFITAKSIPGKGSVFYIYLPQDVFPIL
jgi:signal transduction histidine kinase